MPAFLFRMPAGIPGMLTRVENATVEPQITMPANPPTAYGVPVVIDPVVLQIRPVIIGDVAASVYGILVRPFPTQGNLLNDPLGTGTPAIAGACSVLKRGYIMIQLNGTTAAKKGGAVWLRVAGGTTLKPVGGIEAAVDGTTASNTLLLTGNTYFTGPADSLGNIELAFNI